MILNNFLTILYTPWKCDFLNFPHNIFVKSGSYSNGGLELDIINKINATSIDFNASIAETETTSAYEFPEGQIAYDITCSTTSPSFIGNGDDSTLDIYIDATDDGVLTIALDESIIKPFDDGTFFVLVNNEEVQDFVQEGNKLTIPCNVGDEKISIVGSWAIPEFGTIAVMILVVAIVSIIIVSAKTKLSLVPRY